VILRYKYAYMEEMLGNVAGCRQVFERWMEWEPDEQAWHSYINFELRYKEVDRARNIYEKYILGWFKLTGCLTREVLQAQLSSASHFVCRLTWVTRTVARKFSMGGFL